MTFFNKASLMTLENMYNISAQNQIGQVNVLPCLGQLTAAFILRSVFHTQAHNLILK